MLPISFTTVGFDLDGTLLDTAADLGAAVNHALSLAGRQPVAAEAVAGLIGGGARKMLARALSLTGGTLPEAEHDRLFAELLRHYDSNIAVHTLPYPGTIDALDTLAARGIVVAVATNKREAFARKVLDATGLLDRFAVVLGGDTLGEGRAKPAPDMLQAMVERCGGGPAAFVGDSSFDIRAAAAAGLPSIAVSFGFNDVPASELGADAVIDSYVDLIPALSRLSARAPRA